MKGIFWYFLLLVTKSTSGTYRQEICSANYNAGRVEHRHSCARRRRKKFKSVFFQDMRLEKDTAHEISADNFEEIEAEISCSPSQNGPAVL